MEYISDEERHNRELDMWYSKPSWMGVNQSESWIETMLVAEKYLKQGKKVQIKTVNFGERSREHAPIEYEVHVEM